MNKFQFDRDPSRTAVLFFLLFLLALAPRLPASEAPVPQKGQATAGIRYESCKFDLGFLADQPGERVVFSTSGNLLGEQGTLEMWIKPKIAMKDTESLAALFSVQGSPFHTFGNSMILFYTGTSQIAFWVNRTRLAFSPVLPWKSEEIHHLACTWGKDPPEMFIDGEKCPNLLIHRVISAVPRLFTPKTIPDMPPTLSLGNHAFVFLRDRPARTVIDEVRISDIRRSEEEIRASARRRTEMSPDEHTLLLEHFNGTPLPPLRVCEKGGFASWKVGETVTLDLAVPLPPSPREKKGPCDVFHQIRDGQEKVVREGSLPCEGASSADGSLLTRLPLGSAWLPGYYSLHARVSSAALPWNEGGGFFWIHEPLPATPAASSPFGVADIAADQLLTPDYFSRLAFLGVKWIRLPALWGATAPEEGKWDWRAFERVLASCEAAGLELVPTLNWPLGPKDHRRGAPAWVVDHAQKPPKDPAVFAEYAGEIVRRYRGRVRTWCVWNEPNLPAYWHPRPDAEDYVALLRAAYQAIKAADAEARVIGLSLGFVDLKYAERFFQAGGHRFLDILDVHPYRCPTPPDQPHPFLIHKPKGPKGTLVEAIRAVEALARKYGAEKELWIGEVGYPSEEDWRPGWGVGERLQAAYLVRLYTELLTATSVTRIFWFNGWSIGSLALLRYDYAATPAAVAYRNMVSMLSGCAFLGKGDLAGEGVSVFRFRSPTGKQLAVMWRSGGPATVGIGCEKEGLRICDMLGGVKDLAAQNGKLNLPLSEEPIYIPDSEGLSLSGT